MTDLIPLDAAIAALVSNTDLAFKACQTSVDAIRAIPTIDPAAIREAALREAVKKLRDWQDSLRNHGYPDTAITVGMSADVVEAMIGEKK